MTICEDAPCCGCCGTSLYGNDQGNYYSEPAGLDPYDDRHANDGEPEECNDENHECNDCDGPSNGNGWTCSWCGRPCPMEVHDQQPNQW